MSSLNNSTLHHAIIQHFLQYGFAPSINALTTKFNNTTPQTIISGLKALAEYHGVVLHPISSEIWVCHPFSNAPTNFWIQSLSTGKAWWGNCGWCSLGIAALALQMDPHDSIKITTRLGGESKQIELEIQNGQIVSGGHLLVHFPIPMAKAWDNVVYTCSMVLWFESKGEIQDWAVKHGLSRTGDVQPIESFWKFAQAWYGNHAKENWTKLSMEQASKLFQQFGLIGHTWDLDDKNGGRF